MSQILSVTNIVSVNSSTANPPSNDLVREEIVAEVDTSNSSGTAAEQTTVKVGFNSKLSDFAGLNHIATNKDAILFNLNSASAPKMVRKSIYNCIVVV
jgi:hypothetical protein